MKWQPRHILGVVVDSRISTARPRQGRESERVAKEAYVIASDFEGAAEGEGITGVEGSG